MALTAATPTVKRQKERLVPLLIEVGQELDQDINLQSLATRLGVSSFHFHRTFLGSIGETPKKHVERLRLERASYLLAVTDDPIIDIALAVGFKNPETSVAQLQEISRIHAARVPANGQSRAGRARSAHRLPRQHRLPLVASAVREAAADASPRDPPHGRVRQVPRRVWRRAHAVERPARLGGLARNLDGSSAAWHLLRRPHAHAEAVATRRFLHRGRSAHRRHGHRSLHSFRGGLYGVVEYVGRIDQLLNAFRGLADEIRRSSVYSFGAGPPIDSLLETNVDGSPDIHRIEVAFPVKRVERAQQESSRTAQRRSSNVRAR